MSGVTTSSLSLAWSLRNWLILDYEEANGQTVRPWAPFLLFESKIRGSSSSRFLLQPNVGSWIWRNLVNQRLNEEDRESKMRNEGKMLKVQPSVGGRWLPANQHLFIQVQVSIFEEVNCKRNLDPVGRRPMKRWARLPTTAYHWRFIR